ncbi:MAG: hypothetical protein NXI15_11805 [Gammaproteobacteria bacterium]|jgi:hypothetical protein|nr:hypothetical protein [Gammaproteobacteria bacterium]
MKTITYAATICALLIAGTATQNAYAAGEKDCLLEGKVVHKAMGEQDATMVKIHSVSRYDDTSRCSVRRNQKVEFKLPSDTRLKDAPSGSDVQYRFQSDGEGNDSVELISIGA